jgi:hypothetical protein
MISYAPFLLGACLGAFYFPLNAPSSKVLSCFGGYYGFVLGALLQYAIFAALGYPVPPPKYALGIFIIAGFGAVAVIALIIMLAGNKWYSYLQTVHFYSSYAIGMFALFHFGTVARIVGSIALLFAFWQTSGAFRLLRSYDVFGTPSKGVRKIVSMIESQKYDVIHLRFGEEAARSAYQKGYFPVFSNRDLVIRELVMAAIVGAVALYYEELAGLGLICWHMSSAAMRLGRRGVPSVLYLASSGPHATNFLQRFHTDCGAEFRCVSLLRHADYKSEHLILDNSSLRIREEKFPWQKEANLPWQEAVRLLIHITPVIVIDLRVESSYLRYELDLVRLMNASGKTFLIVDQDEKSDWELELPAHRVTVDEFIERFKEIKEQSSSERKFKFGDPQSFTIPAALVPPVSQTGP